MRRLPISQKELIPGRYVEHNGKVLVDDWIWDDLRELFKTDLAGILKLRLTHEEVCRIFPKTLPKNLPQFIYDDPIVQEEPPKTSRMPPPKLAKEILDSWIGVMRQIGSETLISPEELRDIIDAAGKKIKGEFDEVIEITRFVKERGSDFMKKIFFKDPKRILELNQDGVPYIQEAREKMVKARMPTDLSSQPF